MSNANYWAPGSNNVYCQVCGKKMKAFESKTRYDNLIVCAEDWNPRHPQEFTAFIQPELPPSVIAVNNDIIAPQCDRYHSQALPGVGIPGCMIPSAVYPAAEPTSLFGEPIPYPY